MTRSDPTVPRRPSPSTVVIRQSSERHAIEASTWLDAGFEAFEKGEMSDAAYYNAVAQVEAILSIAEAIQQLPE